MKSKLVLGSDPEGFYATRDPLSDRIKVVPPAVYRLDHGFPTDNSMPRHPVFAKSDGQNGVVKLIEDGADFELTVPPATDMDTLFSDIQLGYLMAKDVAREFGHFIKVIPAIPFDTTEFRDRGEEFRECLIFGCDPDEDVFEVNRPPMEEDALNHPWRYAGGHLHMSGCEYFQTKPLLSIKMLAIFVGNLVTFESPMKKLDHQRTYRYGRPGRYRIQKYGKKFNNIPWSSQGLEYRTPSCAWTTHLPLARKIEAAVRLVAERVLPDDRLMEKLIATLEVPTIEAVMKGLPDLAQATYDFAVYEASK